MEQGSIVVYHGTGAGKSSAALGQAIRAASAGGTVYMITFLKGQVDSGYLKRLEPELKLFRFEHLPKFYDEMSEEEREEEKQNIKNGIGFARKVLATGECDMLILDEVLGAISEGALPEYELIDALSQKSPRTTVILTGRRASDGVIELADAVQNVQKEK